ncbi:MAG: ParB/RepB/Spo0J family partition protein [Burkholderiales bacterium]|nr:ParB/RepB/Spo0J family partition protein [Burkholderiales bacterium]
MATRPKGLGRGLDALLAGDRNEAREERAASLRVDRIVPGKYQPRTRMDPASLAELAESIRAQGVIQPILVRKLSGSLPESYEIIAGERRFRAAQQAGLTEVPVVIREVDDTAALAMALIENIQREDLNPLEEAQGLARLMREFGMTQEAAGQAVGRSRSAAANLLRLLQLPPPLQEMLAGGILDMGHARALLTLDAARQIEIAGKVARRGLSVRETEALARRAAGEAPAPAGRAAGARSRDLVRFEESVAEILGTKVEIVPGRKGGRLVIHYASNDHLSDLVEALKK